MRKSDFVLLVLACVPGLLSAQSTTRPAYRDRALIQHANSSVTVTANAPLPLFQAISAIREAYGWQVSWEQAAGYSPFDVVDDTGPRWRASHPNAKGVTRPAGGLFTSTWPEVRDLSVTSLKADVLAKLIQDYNSTDNPGRHTLRTDPDGQLAVVGTQVKDENGAFRQTTPLLDTPLSVEMQKRTVYDTVRTVLAALSAATGNRIIIMSVPTNLFRATEVEVGGNRVPARELLMEALSGTHRPLQYDFGYDPDAPVYILNVSMALTEQQDALGQRRPVPIDRSR